MRKMLLVGMAVAMLAVPTMASAAPAKDTTVTTTTVGSCNSGTPGVINVANGIATFTLANNQSYGVIKAMPVNLKVEDIKRLSFKSKSSDGGGMVYMNVITNAGHKIKYTPFAQPGISEPGIGAWYTHDMLTSGVRFMDADDNTDAHTWAEAVDNYGNETVNRVSITAGCAIGSGTVQIDRMQVNNSVISFN